MPNALLPPFSSIPIPEYMRRELARRQNTYGLNPTISSRNKIEDYRGQMASWMRVASNGSADGREGFILRGGHGFNNAYGIGKDLSTVIGLDYKGKEHIIKNELGKTLQMHRPTPGIEGLEITITKNVYRTAFIKWKCYSVEQLNYMTPYFMTPYTTIFLEWGWNNYDPTSLVPIGGDKGKAYTVDKNGVETPGSGMVGFYTNPRMFEDSIEKSNGRYDGMIGHVINYDYTFNASDMSFNCTTEIASNSKFYFGLSMNSFVHETEEEDVSAGSNKATKKNIADYLCVNVYAEILASVSKTNSTGQSIGDSPTKHPTDKTIRNLLNGRVFSPRFYRQLTSESATNNDGSPLYITFGCLTDILTEVIRAGRPKFEINIKNAKISAHPNLISCSENFLIPNSSAPYFNPDSMSDSDKRASDSINSENPVHAGGNVNDESNELLHKVLNTYKRQDLSSIINYWRTRHDSTVSYSFPEKNDPYTGNLENIFLNYDFIRDQIKSTPNIRDFLRSICQMLNDNIPIWSLDVIDWEGNFSIRDMNYFRKESFVQLKSSYKIDGNKDVVYYFNPFVQNSVLTEFGFNVKLSDAVANMVINQANNIREDRQSTGLAGVVVNNRYIFPESRDVVLSELKPVPRGTDSVGVSTIGDPQALEKTEPLQNISEKSITFVKNIGNNEKRVTRLVMSGESGKSKVQQLLNDDSAKFTETNTPPIPGVRVEFSLMGISGFRTFQVIGVKNLPKPYEEGKVVFQIVDVKHSVNTEGWVTRVSAVIRPLKSLDASLDITPKS